MWLSDSTVDRLRNLTDWPDLTGTKYELIELMGRGGMGAVYKARDTALGRDVALKVLESFASVSEVSARVLKEARILAALEHPGIVPVHDVGVLADGRPYYVMKLVRGQRLDEQAKTVQGLGERLRIFTRICEAVAFAHAHDVVHRDLKPENVMVGAFGEVLVLDWGVAKVLDAATAQADRDQPPDEGATAAAASEPLPVTGTAASASALATARPRRSSVDRVNEGGPRRYGDVAPRLTETGTVLGTPGYMAPEQASGAVNQVDARSDVYALGGILHFLLTDRAPDAAPGTATEALGPRGAGPPPRRQCHSATARSRRSKAKADLAGLQDTRVSPRALAAIRDKACAAQPEDRYQSVQALATEVERFLNGMAVEAYRENYLAATIRFARRYKTPILLVVTYLVVRLILIFLS